MSFTTDVELSQYPILHFDRDDLTRLGRALYIRASGGHEVDVRAQLDEIFESGVQAAGGLADADRETAFNEGYEKAIADKKEEAK